MYKDEIIALLLILFVLMCGLTYAQHMKLQELRTIAKRTDARIAEMERQVNTYKNCSDAGGTLYIGPEGSACMLKKSRWGDSK